MSTDTERVDEGTETTAFETWNKWYHVPVIGVVMLFMVWVRTQSYDRFVTDDGTPALAGVDSWYHWRTIQWTAENYPYTMPYEVWTGFPTGHYVGQFGTLYDQLIVTAAMIVGLGDPSAETLYTVSLIAIPVMAALVAVPVFYAGRRLGGTPGGIVSILLLAFAPGQFLSRSTIGQLDHHIGEVLFMAIAVLAMMVALRVAEREKPVYELVVDREWTALRDSALYSALAGLALALYIWVWPAGVVLVGIFGVFFVVHLSLDYLRGVSPDHVAFVGAVSLGVTAIVTALLIERPELGVTDFSYLQPIAAVLVAAGCLFMAWLARQWDEREIDRRYYPVAIGGLAAVGVLVMWLALPNLYNMLIGNLTGRLLPFGSSPTGLTVQEVQPPSDFTAHVFEEFGAAFYTMIAGLLLLAARPLTGREYRAEYSLIIVWSLFLISMAATQVRFTYYLLLAVAVVNAAFVADVARLFNLDITSGVRSLRQIETYQVLVVLVVVLLLFAPLLPPVAAQGTTAMDRGEMASPHPDAMLWEESTHWLEANTPEPGAYGGADNADDLEYYGTYDHPEDGDHDYPDGAYGVMSWWDYGHLITVQGERVPHSNPFQQHARTSSAFLTADSEERAELILETIAAGESPLDDEHNPYSTEELEALADEDAHEQMRYVMIDDQMAGGKFSAITAWSGPGHSTYYEFDEYQVDGSGRELPGPSDNYDNTTMASLYLDDADGMEHYRLVHENDDYAFVGGMQFRGGVRPHYSLPFSQYNRLGTGIRLDTGWSDETQEIAADLEEARENDEVYRDLGVPMWDAEVVSTVKTFERVEGAVLTGSVADDAGIEAEEGATVTAEVALETDSERPFTYTQETELEDDGSFELIVPYSTDDELGVEDGYTNSSVEATGEYTVTVDTGDETYRTDVSVPETAVVEGETLEVEGFDEAESGESTADGDTVEQGDDSGATTGAETADEDGNGDGADGADGADNAVASSPTAD